VRICARCARRSDDIPGSIRQPESRMTIREIVGEPLLVHDIMKSKEIEDRVNQLLDLVV